MADTPTLTFAELLMSHRRGELIAEADALLTELVAAVQLTGSKGYITLKIPVEANKAGQIEIAPVLDMKKPRRPLSTGIYYATEDGELTRRDPNQGDWVDDLASRRATGND